MCAREKLFVVSASVKQSKEWIIPELDSMKVGYKHYHADGDDEQDDEFLVLDEIWSDPAIRVVIISPKVTVGASFNVPDIFDRVFAFATPRSVSIRTEFQMIFRVRRPKSPEVHLYIRDHRVPHKTTLAEIRAQIEFDNVTLLQLETNESKQKEIQAWRRIASGSSRVCTRITSWRRI